MDAQPGNVRLTQLGLEAALRAQGLRYAMLPLQENATALLVERGGRLLGPFLGSGEPGLFWVNPAVGSADAFAAFLREGAWNLGGERYWLAPELQWLVRDRSDFWNSHHVPGDYDPGHVTLDQAPDGRFRFRHALALSAHSLAQGEAHLQVERIYRPAANPLRDAGEPADLLEGVRYAGYEQVVSLRSVGSATIPAQNWLLIQLYPGGEIVVPTAPNPTVTDYFEPVDGTVYSQHAHHAIFRITGNRRYKVGLRAAHTVGRLGYLAAQGDDATLMVRCFFNNPSGLYTEEPAQRPGARGDSVHVYNDGGGFGGFGELEVQGQAIGAEAGLSSLSERFLLWVYQGPAAQISRIGERLLGVQPLATGSLPMA